ncbi:Putative JmjC domain-containing protein [Colletotrichum destructivum]|uniref:JmjC domain-containing protein n=1 Tax=Colletotrichum destructivum TaxID=34406 RepID=A0AAX4J4Y6_9PEZI|nr:Putative JmjC domain-containing protein [Colletotrichum destructivum]
MTTSPDLGVKTSKTLGDICQNRDVVAKGFAKVTVTDYNLHTGGQIKFRSSDDGDGSRVDDYAMRVSQPEEDDGNFIIEYDAINVVAGEITVDLSAQAAVTERQGIFSPASENTRSGLGPSQLTHYYIGDWDALERSQPPVLLCGDLLEKAFSNRVKPGITTPYLYYTNDALTCSGMHLEDVSVPSVNLVRWGASKAWLILEPGQGNIERFESCVKQCMQQRVKRSKAQRHRPYTTAKCSQFVRHQNTLFTTETLGRWKVRFNIVFCGPGELIVTMPGTYHQVVNLGPNLAEAVNVAWPGVSIPPPDYVYCSKKRCDHSDSISKADLVAS